MFKLCTIAYPQEYIDLMQQFNSLEEASLQGLEIMQRILEEYNPAHYTIWKRRWEFIIALDYDLENELVWITELLMENPKTYQIWNYRQKIISHIGQPQDELQVISEILTDDAKNYHAWSYRQWIIKKFSLFDHELDYTALLISQDPYNNSAWNQRYFLFKMTRVNVDQELEFIKENIQKYPRNESVWNYYRGLVRDREDLDSEKEFIKSFIDSPFALYTLFEWTQDYNERKDVRLYFFKD